MPGGKRDEADDSFVATALRETYEEIGVLVAEKQVIGELTNFYIPPSNFIIQPVVAWLENTPNFILSEREVVEVLEIPIAHFAYSEEIKKEKLIKSSYANEVMPYYNLDQHSVWGATAMILSELRAVWREIFPQNI